MINIITSIDEKQRVISIFSNGIFNLENKIQARIQEFFFIITYFKRKREISRTY